MSFALSPIRRDALTKAQEIFNLANLHTSNQLFRVKMREDFGFYEGGLGQWLPSDLEILAERKQVPLTVNLLQSLIDNLSGVEIQSRYRTACRSDSQNEADEKLAEALTHILYYIQENNSIPHLGSLKFRDMLICGMGWSYLYKENGIYKYEYVHPYNIIQDPDDLTPQYTNMRYVCRKRWMRPEVIKKMWPKVDLDNPDSYIGLYEGLTSPELMDRDSNYTDPNFYTGVSKSRLLVVEVQHKIEQKAYAGLDQKGHTFETFDEEEAEEIANSPKDIEEIPSSRIMRTLFMGNQLLEYGPLDPDLPNPADFSYIPCVWKRNFATGVPYGLLEGGKSLQRDLNVRLTKSVYAFNSTRIVAETDEMMEGNAVEAIREELKSPDSIIFLPKESKFQISPNTQLGDDQLKIVEMAVNLLPRVMGINDEMLGRETNATSGIAQNIRQVNSVRTHVFAFDDFSEMKKREAKFMLSQIQASFDPNIAVQIVTPEQNEWLVLNMTYETKDGPKIANDIRGLPLTLYIEEVPDYRSSFEETQAKLEALLGNANANLIMLSPEMMKQLGIRDAEKLAAEMQKALQLQMQMKQGVEAGNPQGMPQEQLMPPQQMISGGG
jgi:hypothetical protein